MKSTLWRVMKAFSILLILAVATTEGYAQFPCVPGPLYVPPSWDQTLVSATRFNVLSNWGCAAVLDRETGLVWEQAPDPTGLTWTNAIDRCTKKFNLLGKLGWRLPTIEELGSLTGPTGSISVGLPLGHPFTVSPGVSYWSSTTSATDPNNAWYWQQSFTLGVPGAPVDTFAKSTPLASWCVRGGHGYDAR